MFDDIFDNVLRVLKHSDVSNLCSVDESRASVSRIQLALDLTVTINELMDKPISDYRYARAHDGRVWKCFDNQIIRFYRNDNGHVIGTNETHIYGDVNSLLACDDVQEIDHDTFNTAIKVMGAPF
jgi:hypothetical protein